MARVTVENCDRIHQRCSYGFISCYVNEESESEEDTWSVRPVEQIQVPGVTCSTGCAYHLTEVLRGCWSVTLYF